MNFIDAHCHVISKKILRDFDVFKKQWVEGGIKKIINVSSTLHESEKSLETFANERMIINGVGKHPWKVKNDNYAEQLRFEQLIAEKECQIIGEVGLDYYAIKQHERYDWQRKWFTFFIKMANKYKKQLNVHVTGAEEDIYSLLNKYWDRSVNVNIHWYSGSESTLKQLIELGCYFSINPAIQYSQAHQRALQHIPIENILSESDGDVFYKQLNLMGQPGIIPIVIDKIAELKKMSKNEIVEFIEINFEKYLKLK